MPTSCLRSHLVPWIRDSRRYVAWTRSCHEMGWGAYLAMRKGFISEAQMKRIMDLISNMELSLYHPIMDDGERIFKTQLKIIEKRGGHLCAPVPRGEIGECGYIQDLSLKEITQYLIEYKELCKSYPREGRGIDAHCADVGLEDPATVGQRKETAKLSQLEQENAMLKERLEKMTSLSGAEVKQLHKALGDIDEDDCKCGCVDLEALIRGTK